MNIGTRINNKKPLPQEIAFKETPDFELFKSEICHRVKREGDISFIKNVLLSNEILKLYNNQWYPESLYLLAMVDYLSRENEIPLYNAYNNLRNIKFKNIWYPADIRLMASVLESDEPLINSLKNCISEFLRHNIVESEIRNVY